MVSATFVLGYIGPGGALSAFATFVALLAAVVFAVIGFLWYPILRLRQALRRGPKPPQDAPVARSPEP